MLRVEDEGQERAAEAAGGAENGVDKPSGVEGYGGRRLQII